MTARLFTPAALALAVALGTVACTDVVPTEPVGEARFSRSTDNAGRNGTFTDRNDQPFSQVMHTCDGDNVLISGRMQSRIAAFANRADRVHFQMHVTLLGSGISEVTGLRYQFMEVHHAVYNYLAGGLGPFTTNHVHRHRLIAQGPHPDRWIKTSFHHTISATGEITASWLRVEADCQ